MKKAAITAMLAASVAVNMPPKIPPMMITGRRKAHAASLKVTQSFLRLNVSSMGYFFLTAK